MRIKIHYERRVWIKRYRRKDDTLVRGHFRRRPKGCLNVINIIINH